MNPQELRIGNYIRYRQEWDCEVESLGHHFSTNNKDLTNRLYALQCGSTDIDDYNPIPLTEEWLVRFGFEKSNDDEYTREALGADICFLTFHSDFVFSRILFKSGKWVLVTPELLENEKVQHVHQLQNLYFSLTG